MPLNVQNILLSWTNHFRINFDTLVEKIGKISTFDRIFCFHLRTISNLFWLRRISSSNYNLAWPIHLSHKYHKTINIRYQFLFYFYNYIDLFPNDRQLTDSDRSEWKIPWLKLFKIKSSYNCKSHRATQLSGIFISL